MRIANLKAVCGSDVLELHRQSTASERLAEVWQRYERSHQDILGMVSENKVDNVQVAFLEKPMRPPSTMPRRSSRVSTGPHSPSEQHS